MAYKELKGVGGWLRFLVISLTVLSPLYTISQTNGDITKAELANPALTTLAAWHDIVATTWAFALAQSAIAIYAGWRLSNRFVANTPTIAILCLWIGGPALTLISFVVLSAISHTSLNESGGEIVTAVMRHVISAGIWSAYLMKSVRVENTYFDNAYGLQSANEDSETVAKAVTRDSFWRKMPRERRRLIFFAARWVAVILVFAVLFDGDDGYFAGYSGRAWGRIWTWALVPPTLAVGGLWAYARFVEGPNPD